MSLISNTSNLQLILNSSMKLPTSQVSISAKTTSWFPKVSCTILEGNNLVFIEETPTSNKYYNIPKNSLLWLDFSAASVNMSMTDLVILYNDGTHYLCQIGDNDSYYLSNSNTHS